MKLVILILIGYIIGIILIIAGETMLRSADELKYHYDRSRYDMKKDLCRYGKLNIIIGIILDILSTLGAHLYISINNWLTCFTNYSEHNIVLKNIKRRI